jgi:hypothetical protein
MKDFSQTCNDGAAWLRRLMRKSSRLSRLMCGKASPFRNDLYFSFEAMPHEGSARRSLAGSGYQVTERQSLSAHQAAKPHTFFSAHGSAAATCSAFVVRPGGN